MDLFGWPGWSLFLLSMGLGPLQPERFPIVHGGFLFLFFLFRFFYCICICIAFSAFAICSIACAMPDGPAAALIFGGLG